MFTIGRNAHSEDVTGRRMRLEKLTRSPPLSRSLRRLRRSSFGGTGLEALIKLADCVHTRGLRRRDSA